MSCHLVDSSAAFGCVEAFKLQHGIEHQPSQHLVVSLVQLSLQRWMQLSADPDKRARVVGLQGAPEEEKASSPSESGHGGGKGDGSRKRKGGKSDRPKG